MSQSKSKILSTHKQHITDPTERQIEQLLAGDVVKFLYDGKERFVFVLNPNYEGKLHGLSLSAVDRKTFLSEVVPKLGQSTTAMDFYKDFLSGKNETVFYAYRTYFLKNVTQVNKMKYSLDRRTGKTL